MTTFSIIVPVYKVEKYVKQCIESILAQTFEDFEILCVDDCGGDNSIKIVEDLAKTDSRIRIFYQDKNRGVGAARNLALDNAIGEYFFCVDSDDWINPNTLQVLYDAFKYCTTESIWFNGYRYYDATGTYQDEPICNYPGGYVYLTPENVVSFPDMCGMKAYRTESVRKLNIHWPTNIKFDEDGHFYFRYYSHHHKVLTLKDCLYNYRIREGSVVTTFQNGNGTPADIFQTVKETRDFYKKEGIYEEHKISLVKLMQNRINMMLQSCPTNENKKLAIEFLKNMDFPADYECLDIRKKPLVSVVVPFYNVEPYIEQCLRSIMEQTYRNLEIICVDDCGQDKSINIVKKLAKEDSRIKIIRHKQNKGLGGARTTGLHNATGEIMFFIDSDDWIERNCISLVVQKFNETGLDSVWFKADYWLEAENRKAPMDFNMYFYNMPEGYLTLNETNLGSLPLITWNKAYRRNFLMKHSLDWPEKIIYEDVEFYWKAFTKTRQIYLLDKCLYFYRQRAGSIMQLSQGNIEKSRTACHVLREVYKYLKEENILKDYKDAYYKYANEIINNFGAEPEEKLKTLELIMQE
ncbi:glycosyltransferase family 2 protein [bacterium]|nr:glycosyltransferase family 2 protein [bacterium]